MKQTKRCPECEQTLGWAAFGKNAARYDGLNPYCTPCRGKRNKGREQMWRTRALEELGGACAHCGIEDRRVLCIDHLDGGGHRERTSPGTKKQSSFYRKVALDTTGFQALCWNCNWIKRLECDGRAVTELALTA